MLTYEHAQTTFPKIPTLRVGIQGPPGSGKTASALTFPNPIFADFDHIDIPSLLALPHLKDVKPQVIPFYNVEFCKDKLGMKPNKMNLVPKHSALKKWIMDYGSKLTSEQTLILDSWTTLQDAFDEYTWSEPIYNSAGKVDDRAPWSLKLDFSTEISNMIKDLTCNVVVLFHEVQARDPQSGVLLDKIMPLMQGQFVAKIKIYYPNFFKASVEQKKDQAGKPIEGNTPEYFWQVKSDNKFDAKCSKVDLPFKVPAYYSSLIK
jgi:hypothetical protein